LATVVPVPLRSRPSLPAARDRPVVHIVFPRQEGRTDGARGRYNGVTAFPMRSLPIFVLGALARREGWDVVCVNENVDPLPSERPDLAMISVWTCLAPSAYLLADQYRAAGVPVVLGGIHPSMLPGEGLRHADAVVVGEAEAVMPELLADAVAGRLQPIYQGAWGDMSLVPRTDEFADLYTQGALRRSPVHGLQTSRGCKFNCGFCSVIRLNGRKMRHLDAERVVDELRLIATLPPRLPFPTPVYFHDDDLFSDRDFTALMLEEIIRSGLDLKLSWPTSIGMARDPELLDLAQRAGCVAVFIGLESVSRSSLLQANKKNRPREYEELVGNFHRHGIGVSASLIFGFDEDEADVAEQTVEFLDAAGVDSAKFFALTPLPGTETFAQLYRDGRIVDFDWGKYDVLHAVIEPMRMTTAELQDAVWRAHALYYGKRRLARRVRRMVRTLPWSGVASFGVSGLTYAGKIAENRTSPVYEPDPADLVELLATSTAPANEAMTTAVAQAGERGTRQPVRLSARPT